MANLQSKFGFSFPSSQRILFVAIFAERPTAGSFRSQNRTRKIGGTTLRSISDISRHQRLRDNNDTTLSATDMLAELCSDNKQLTAFLRQTHEVCDRNDDVATASLIENWIDETEGGRGSYRQH